MNNSRVIPLAMGFVAAMSCMSMAQASFVLYLDDLGTPGIDVILSDDAAIGTATAAGPTNSLDSFFPALGTMTFLGSAGAFNVNVTTGVSKPVEGGDVLHLNSVNVTSGGGGGTLLIALTDTGYLGAYPGYGAAYSSTTTGTVDFDFLHDPANAEFGGTSFHNPVAMGGPSFSGSGSGPIAPGSPYSLSIFATITHAGAQTTSLDAQVSPIPVPAAVWLFGSGLLGIVGIARRKAA